MTNIRTAELLRPKTFDEMVGQEHLFGKNGVIRKMSAANRITNMIFYGPPGTGKTTAAEIIARESGMVFHKLNATSASLSDVKDVLSSTNNIFGMGGVLLYLDEIQYFNKKQQQSLLEYIEDGRVTLIASTTENPHFCVYNAIISRSSLFEFRPVAPKDIAVALSRALDYLNGEYKTEKRAAEGALEYIGKSVGGDVRRGMVLLENAYFAAESVIDQEVIDGFNVRIGNFDDDTHFDLLSCLQKSIRGSDPDATAFYMAKLLSMGELLSVIRRLQVIASEDIGLAYPMAAAITRACCDSARELGMPEARIPLINAAIMLATAPKSNSAYEAYAAAQADIDAGLGREVPAILQSPLFKGYKYPHSYPNHYVKQDYLPNDLKGKKYYQFGDNKTEEVAAKYWALVKGEKK